MMNKITESDMILPVTKIQRFCTHDGPGIRTVVFLKGCPLRCVWCHNPETQLIKYEFFWNENLCIGCRMCMSVCEHNVHIEKDKQHIIERSRCVGCRKCAEICPSGAIENCSQDKSINEIMSVVISDKVFYGKDGGITVSGGEPTVHGEKLITLLGQAKRQGINTVLETCGYCDPNIISSLAELVDLFLWDIKDGCDERHMENTGVSNKRIIDNLKLADSLGVRTIMRCILIRTVNDDIKNFETIAKIYRELSHCEGVEIIPYHTFGCSKNITLGREENAHREWMPMQSDISHAVKMLRGMGVKIHKH